MLSKLTASLAMNRNKENRLQLPLEMLDKKSMPEFIAELFTYTPTILADAMH